MWRDDVNVVGLGRGEKMQDRHGGPGFDTLWLDATAFSAFSLR
jgi:hypothetical protein